MWRVGVVSVLGLLFSTFGEAAEHHQFKLTVAPQAIEAHFKDIQQGVGNLGLQLDVVDPVSNQIFVSGPLLPRSKVSTVPHVTEVQLFQPIETAPAVDPRLRLYEFIVNGALIKAADREAMIKKLLKGSYRFTVLWTGGDRFQVVGPQTTTDYFTKLLDDDRILSVEESHIQTPQPAAAANGGLRYYQIGVRAMTDDEKVELVEAILATGYRFTSHWESNGFLRMAGPAQSEEKIQALAAHPKVFALFGHTVPPPDIPALFIYLEQLNDANQIKLDFQIEKQKLATRTFAKGVLISGNVTALKELETYFLENIGPADKIKWFKDVIFKFGEPSLAAPLALDWAVSPTEEILRDLNFRIARYGASIRALPVSAGVDSWVLAVPDSSFARVAVTRALPGDVVRVRPVEACEAALKGQPKAPEDLEPD